MGCATGLVKLLVFAFNFIFNLSGLVILIMGILMQINYNGVVQAVEASGMVAVPILLIVLGSFIFVISFLGCCGALRESSCMLTTYAIIILVIFLAQVALGVFAFLQIKDEKDFENIVQKNLQKVFNKYATDEAARESFDLIQSTAECCGVNGKNDWAAGAIPDSCYKDNNSNKSPFSEGCTKKLTTLLIDSMELVGYIVLGLCATELIAAIFSLCLSSSIKNERRRAYS